MGGKIVFRRIGLFIAFLLLASPLSAHEAHRQNAPDPVASVSVSSPASELSTADALTSESGSIASEAENDTPLIVDFLGRLHPFLVHFPIALLLMAALAEFILFLNPAAGLYTTVRFLVWTGAAGGILAGALGWFAAGFRLSDRSEILGLHRWNGTGIAIGTVLLALIVPRPDDVARRRTAFRVLLVGIAGLLLWQGYLGGELVMGPDHLGLKGE